MITVLLLFLYTVHWSSAVRLPSASPSDGVEDLRSTSRFLLLWSWRCPPHNPGSALPCCVPSSRRCHQNASSNAHKFECLAPCCFLCVLYRLSGLVLPFFIPTFFTFFCYLTSHWVFVCLVPMIYISDIFSKVCSISHLFQ